MPQDIMMRRVEGHDDIVSLSCITRRTRCVLYLRAEMTRIDSDLVLKCTASQDLNHLKSRAHMKPDVSLEFVCKREHTYPWLLRVLMDILNFTDLTNDAFDKTDLKWEWVSIVGVEWIRDAIQKMERSMAS